MNQDLRQINDKQLLCQTRELVTKEREVLTHILNHLREVERRKLFCDFRCQSLFEFTVKELKYSEGQACRRISAMRLMNEFSVEVKQKMEKKIASGSLSLSNVSQAQSFFREARKRGDSVAPDEKLEVLQSLEDKSAREGQKVLIRRNPLNVLSKKGEKLTLPEEIANKLEEFRALLGAKGAQLSLDELIGELAQMGIDSLKAKKFGKKRSQPDASTFVSGGT